MRLRVAAVAALLGATLGAAACTTSTGAEPPRVAHPDIDLPPDSELTPGHVRPGETLGSITLSLGVAQYVPGEAIEDTINRADACLYAAKRGGRNRVMSEKTVDPTELKRKATA